MSFKKMRGVRLDYYRQGLIYFTCANYKIMPEETKDRIKAVCSEVTYKRPEYYAPLFALMTERYTVIKIAEQYYMSQETLYRLRKAFYETWYKIKS